MKAAGMATVHVQNPSAAVVEVTLAGEGSQSGVVGPHTAIDLLASDGVPRAEEIVRQLLGMDVAATARD